MGGDIGRNKVGRTRRRWLAAGVSALALATAAGCGGSGGAGTSAGRAAEPAIGAPAGAANGAPAGTRPSTGHPQKAGTLLPAGQRVLRGGVPIDRSIVYTGDLSLRVGDVRATADHAVAVVTAAGGYLFSEESDDADHGPADLTFKVPAPRFTDVLGSLGRLGTLQSRSESAQDVTDQVVDLTSRVDTARASVARIRALLAKATRIGEIISIEGELTQREADLESLEGQLGVLSSQVAMSTLSLHLSAKAATPPPAHKAPGGFVGGLRRGWHAFVTAGTALVTAIGAALPFVLLLGAAAAAAWWVSRWVRRSIAARRAGPPAEA